MKKLPKQIKTIWMQTTGLSLLGWIILAIAYWFILMRMFQWTEIILWIIIAIGIIEVIVELALIPYRYAFNQFKISDRDVEIQKGFFFRDYVAIPIARVQNVDLNQGPLLIQKHLYAVDIVTASDRHRIDALTEEHAKGIKDQVMKLAREAQNEI